MLKHRLRRLERAAGAGDGARLLPVCLVLRPDAPEDERQRIMREYRQRKATGQTVLLISQYGDPLAALVDEIGP